MPWFDRLNTEDPQKSAGLLDKAVAKSGIPQVLEAACGRFGKRRFVVRFDGRAGNTMRVVGMESERLPGGGGPPPPAAFDANVRKLEGALATLRRTMPAPFTFSAGAVGVRRATQGEPVLSFRFDEDAATFALKDLSVPEGAGSLVEDPAYLRAIAAWEGRIAPIRANWVVAHEAWSFAEGRIHTQDRVYEGTPLASWEPTSGTLAWALEKPAGDESPFVEREVLVELSGAMELAAFAAARMKLDSLFQGAADDGRTWFLGIRSQRG